MASALTPPQAASDAAAEHTVIGTDHAPNFVVHGSPAHWSTRRGGWSRAVKTYTDRYGRDISEFDDIRGHHHRLVSFRNAAGQLVEARTELHGAGVRLEISRTLSGGLRESWVHEETFIDHSEGRSYLSFGRLQDDEEAGLLGPGFTELRNEPITNDEFFARRAELLDDGSGLRL